MTPSLEKTRRAGQSPLPLIASGWHPGTAIQDTIHRRYFIGAILLSLGFGAGWGTWLLWRIGQASSFTGASVHTVNAHGQAQIYGWVGLFIMGFAYQMFPRLWQSRLAAPRLAGTVFLLVALGVIVRTIGMSLDSASQSVRVTLAMLGGGMEMLGILLFVGQMLLTWRSGRTPMTAQSAFLFAAMGFFLLQGALDLWHTWMTMTAATRDELVWYISAYQGPLRDLQIHGLALFMILGVSMRLLPAMFHLPSIPPRRAWCGWGMLVCAVLGEVALFIAYRFTESHVLAALLLVPWLLLAAGCWTIIAPWRPWRPMPVHDRSAKFIRASFGWLAVALTMLLMLPVYLLLSGLPFSHAYYGAIRHAITVGFISMMIVGTASRVVPRLNGIDPRPLSALWVPFILLNTGCFLRVSLQTLTDWSPIFYMLVALSGVLELAALSWWGWEIIRLIHQARRRSAAHLAHGTFQGDESPEIQKVASNALGV